MIEYIFLGLLLVIAIIDYLYFKIHNVIVLPAILIGIYLTGNWLSALIMFLLTAYLYKQNFWRGGDVKLMCLIGAFLGMKAIIIFLLTLLLIYLYKIVFKKTAVLAVSPFSFISVLLLNIYSVTIGTRC